MDEKKYTEEELKALPFRDESLDLETRVDDLLNRMTLEEKFRIMPGHWIWKTRKVKRLGIPPFRTTDGPVGVARHSSYRKNTRFPTSILVAASWDRTLAHKLGKAMGEETRATGRHCILAPGINVHRTPLCGRTFEYLSEDPYLIKEIASPIVKGIQEVRTAACVKHYAANNQEHNRFKVNAIIDERTLNEIYLRPFKQIVEMADPWTFMACYNQVNGKYGCESKALLKDYLMDKFGFRGLVMSDWFATRNIESTADCVKAGLSLEMPRHILYKKKHLQEAVESGEITEEDIDFVVKRTLRVMFLVGLFDDPETLPQCERNTEEHQKLTKKLATQGMVLLKNEKDMLPIDPAEVKSIHITGPNAKKKMGRTFYGGSSAAVPPYEVKPKKGIKNYCKKHGIEVERKAEDADLVIFVGGLNHGSHLDTENQDKFTLEMPKDQIQEIYETLEKNKNMVMVLINGSPICMDSWLNMVPAVLEAWYPGMESGNAIAEVLFGEVNPSGKLPTTFPKNLMDSSAHQSFQSYPGDENVYYKEGIFIGYRYFDENKIEPLFPFGFGLSYTDFSYANVSVDKTQLSDEINKFIVSADIKNVGDVSGKEVVQVYGKCLDCSVERPPKELIGFEKVSLEPGQTKRVQIPVNTDDLAYFDETEHKWKIDKGTYNIMVGSSSRDINLEIEVHYS